MKSRIDPGLPLPPVQRWVGVVLTIALLTAAAWVGVERVADWHRQGWTGVLYLPPLAGGALSGPLGDLAGAVVMVADGSPAERAGIEAGDVVAAVDGIGVDRIDELRGRSAAHERGDRVVLTLKTLDGLRQVELELVSPFARLPTLVSLTVGSLLGMAFVGIGLWMVWTGPRSPALWPAFGLCAVGGALFFLRAFGGLDLPSLRGTRPFDVDATVVGVIGVGAVVLILLHTLTLHLFLVFPEPRPVTRHGPVVFGWIHSLGFMPLLMLGAGLATLLAPGWTTMLSIGAAALATVCVAWVARDVPRRGWRGALVAHPVACQAAVVLAAAALGPVGRRLPETVLVASLLLIGVLVLLFLLAFLLGCSGLAFGALWRGYRESSDETLRRRVRWILWSLGVMVEAVILAMAAGVLFGTWSGLGPAVLMWADLLAHLVYLLIPVSLALSLLGIGLDRVDAVCRRTVVWGGIVGFVALVWMALVGGLGRVVVGSTLGTATFAVAALAVVLPFVPPLRRRLEAWAAVRL